MRQIQPDIAFALAKGEVAELQAADQYDITCLTGDLWMTQLGDFRDTIIEAGETVIAHRDGAALITSLGGPAEVLVRLKVELAYAA